MRHNAYKVFYVSKEGQLSHKTWWVSNEEEAINETLCHFHRAEPVFLKVVPVTVCRDCCKTVDHVNAYAHQCNSCAVTDYIISKMNQCFNYKR